MLTEWKPQDFQPENTAGQQEHNSSVDFLQVYSVMILRYESALLKQTMKMSW